MTRISVIKNEPELHYIHSIHPLTVIAYKLNSSNKQRSNEGKNEQTKPFYSRNQQKSCM